MKKFLVLWVIGLLTAGPGTAAETGSPVIVFETSQGNFEARLFNDIAPKASENMVQLAEKGYFDGTVFHRVIAGFMVQGGDPTASGSGGQSIWGEDFEDEVSPLVGFDRKGLLGMANRGPKTNGSQFFITVAPTPHLNNRHTIFGEITSGYDIVEKISLSPTNAGDRPVVDQKIIKAYLKKSV